MAAPSSAASRRRTLSNVGDGEKGLAEWTSRIRQLQQDVDDDFEQEQRRLADEIAKSRLERTRRRGTGTYALPPDLEQENAGPPEDMQQIVDRQQNQSDALRKLVGSSPSQAAKPEPMSLAQFMGGRATGPRLNKVEAQPEAADYANYERPMAVHPLFGSSALSPQSSDGASVAQRARVRSEASPVALPGLASSTKRPFTPPAATPVAVPAASSPLRTRPVSMQPATTRTPEPARTTTFSAQVASPGRAFNSSHHADVASTPTRSYGSPHRAFGSTKPEAAPSTLNDTPSSGPAPSLSGVNASTSTSPPSLSAPDRFSSTPANAPSVRAASPSKPAEAPRAVTPSRPRSFVEPARAVTPTRTVTPTKAETSAEHVATPTETTKSRPTTPYKAASSPVLADAARSSSPNVTVDSYPTTPQRPSTASNASARAFSPTGGPGRASGSAAFTPSSSGGDYRAHGSPATTPSKASQSAVVPAPSFLARPLPPRAPAAQQIIPNSNVSLAFLKPSVEKKPTPSLSRLKGRGFVEQRVKASAQLTEQAGSPSSRDPPSPLPLKKTSVAEMWAKREEDSAAKSPPSPTPAKKVGRIATPFAKLQQETPSSPSSSQKATSPPARSPEPITLPGRVQLPPGAVKLPMPSKSPAPAPAQSPSTPAASKPPAPVPSRSPAPSPYQAPAPTTTKSPAPPKTPEPKPVAAPAVPLGSSHTMVSFAKTSAQSASKDEPSKPLTHLTKDRPKRRKGGSIRSPSQPVTAPSPAPVASGSARPTPSPEPPASTASSGAEHASDFDSIRVRSELIKQFPSPPTSSPGEFGSRGATSIANIIDNDSQIINTSASIAPAGFGSNQVLPVAGAGFGSHQGEAGHPVGMGFGSQPAEQGFGLRPAASFVDETLSAGAEDAQHKKGVAAAVEAWADRAPIGVQALRRSSGDSGQQEPQVVGHGRGRALPGLADVDVHGGTSPFSSSGSASSNEEKNVAAPKHARIPSTRTRASVLDVARAMSEHHERESSMERQETSTEPIAPTTTAQQEPEEPAAKVDVRSVKALWERQGGSSDSERDHELPGKVKIPQWSSPASTPEPVQQQTPPPSSYSAPIPRARQVNPERRRSAYANSVVLPPLEEVAETVTPVTSLSRTYGTEVAAEVAQQQQPSPVDIPQISAPEPELFATMDSPIDGEMIQPGAAPAAADEPVINFEHEDGLLPAFNLNAIHAPAYAFVPNPGQQTISVEVLLVSGSNATPAPKPVHLLYETETVAVVHRVKDGGSGLVLTKVWAWRGKDANPGEREEAKLAELAKRFGTALIECPQGAEHLEFVHVLGGVLLVRQGPRAHWSIENTAMHRVHDIGGIVFVDQLDLDISNLCSAYSYVLSILGALYVWNGRGASDVERKQALSYANTMTASPDDGSIVELEEGSEDEMFWAMLGDEPYARAEYWQWRRDLHPTHAPRLFRINSLKGKDAVKLAPNQLAARDLVPDGVFVLDAVFEVFVIVGREARNKRTDIRLALYIAENISMAVAQQRPFDPVIHALVLPSLFPCDVKALFRDFDEAALNGDTLPEHMNLLPYENAHEHLARQSWPLSDIADADFLPLGLSPEMVETALGSS